MHIQYKNDSKLSNCYATLLIVSIVLVFAATFFKWGATITAFFSTIAALLGPFTLKTLSNQRDDEETIRGVYPNWKLIDYPKNIKFFSTNGKDTVVDSVRFCKVELTNNTENEVTLKKILSINNVPFSTISEKKEKNESTNSFIETISPNGVLESGEGYSIDLKDNPTKSSIENSKDSLENKDEVKVLFVIKSTTIYGDQTIYFEGAELKGSAILNEKNKLEPYSGDWDSYNKNYIYPLSIVNKLEELGVL